MDEHKKWKKIEHRLEAAGKRLSEAEVLMKELPNASHISDNLTPVRESVERFRSLASDKVEDTKPEPKAVSDPW